MAPQVLYMGVSVASTSTFDYWVDLSQILRNDPQPALELAVEKDLSSFSRFTRQKYFLHSRSPFQSPRLITMHEQLWRVHDDVR